MKNISKILRIPQGIWIIGLLLVLPIGFVIIYPLQALAIPTCGMSISTNTTLTSDLTVTGSDNGICITADFITLNCNGHNIIGGGNSSSSGNGISLSSRTGVTVKNCNVTLFFKAFSLDNSSGNTLKINTADNNQLGFDLENSSNNNTLAENMATNNNNGFTIGASSFNTLTCNTRIGTHNANFLLNGANNNTLKDNTANSNVGNFKSDFGFDLISSSNNILKENTAIGNPASRGFFLTESSGNTLKENMACNNGVGDAAQSGGTGNVFKDNAFCTTFL